MLTFLTVAIDASSVTRRLDSFKYLAIYSNENLTNNLKCLPKWDNFFPKY